MAAEFSQKCSPGTAEGGRAGSATLRICEWASASARPASEAVGWVVKLSRKYVTIRRFNRRARRGLNVRAASSAAKVSLVPASMFRCAKTPTCLRPWAVSLRKYELQSKPSQRVSCRKTARSKHKSS